MTPKIKFALLALEGCQVAFLLLHDWIPLGRFTNLPAVHSSDSRSELLRTTFLSALPFVLVFVVSCVYWRASAWPGWLLSWLRVSYLVLLAGALWAWWIPYLALPDPKRALRYRQRFAGTLRFLPERNGIAPDTLHVFYDSIIVITLVLSYLA